MSALLGVLSVTGKGGAQLFVFDDAVVRATTGMALAASLLLDSNPDAATISKPSLIGESMSSDLSRYTTMTPEQIALESKGNQGVWTRDVTAATLAPGRWPATGLRRLSLTLGIGETRVFEWPGDGATRPLNRDADAVALLSRAFGDLLEVRLKHS